MFLKLHHIFSKISFHFLQKKIYGNVSKIHLKSDFSISFKFFLNFFENFQYLTFFQFFPERYLRSFNFYIFLKFLRMFLKTMAKFFRIHKFYPTNRLQEWNVHHKYRKMLKWGDFETFG